MEEAREEEEEVKLLVPMSRELEELEPESKALV